MYEGIETDGAISVTTMLRLFFDLQPELRKFVGNLALLAHGETTFLLCVHGSLDVWEE